MKLYKWSVTVGWKSEGMSYHNTEQITVVAASAEKAMAEAKQAYSRPVAVTDLNYNAEVSQPENA